jgi:hypothetical protein
MGRDAPACGSKRIHAPRLMVNLDRRHLVLVGTVTHVLTIDSHCRGRFVCGRMPFVTGATDKRDERKGNNEREDQIFNHIDLVKGYYWHAP